MKNKFLIIFLGIFTAGSVFFTNQVRACNYSERNDTYYCIKDECLMAVPSDVSDVISQKKLSRENIDRLLLNDSLKSLCVKDMSNFTLDDIEALYPQISYGRIDMAAVCFSYKNYYDSFGNDGTALYQKVLKTECPNIITKRSCASVVSAAINAAGCADYGSEGCAGLIQYFEGENAWHCLGKLTEKELRPGDIIFIDRRSHMEDYESGNVTDAEYKVEEVYIENHADETYVEEDTYTGGYDATGHKNYDTVDPTGNYDEVFSPDQDGDGEVGEWESEYWRVYWERANRDKGGSVPPYEYYYTWKEEAEEAKRKKKEEARARKEQEEQKKKESEKKESEKKVVRKVSSPRRIVHNHIFVWTGNDAIKTLFPDSKGNIVSGSYTERYANARSAAVSKFDFTGDYRVYRYDDDTFSYYEEVSYDDGYSLFSDVMPGEKVSENSVFKFDIEDLALSPLG